MLERVEDIKRIILKDLMDLGKIGGAHTVIFNLAKGLSNDIICSKKGKKAFKKAVKELIQNQFLLAKPSTGEIHVSINPRKIKEIKEFLKLES